MHNEALLINKIQKIYRFRKQNFFKGFLIKKLKFKNIKIPQEYPFEQVEPFLQFRPYISRNNEMGGMQNIQKGDRVKVIRGDFINIIGTVADISGK